MEISLIRHGRSTCTDSNRMKCKEFKIWVGKYDNQGVFEENFYPEDTLDRMASANIVFSSDLERSIESARLLKPNLLAVSDPLFRETELPNPSVGSIKLSPSTWSLILRCLWFLGYSRDCESLKEAKDRAEKASELLAVYAEIHTSIVLVGHGFFNMLIAKELQKMGWEGKKRSSSKHWNCTTYTLLN
ncbi:MULTISPECIES: histidine phosphatase family protein [Sporosarcina]|uniref:histidine phosphatase family protein n=1 Tax=Sporosarcina TaxID=1569 RepID=UPI001C8DA015|nr:histidine phosphatase family protein [Sporosarcina aquimarina]MBY0221287.1 histidine phosphatase family protein [Sporosarcina aquimarina]